MKKILSTCVLLTTVLSLGACSLVYQPAKQEGTVFDNQQVAKIANGQTKEQVTYILGNPNVRIQLANDSWYYIERDVSSHGQVTEKVFEIKFDQTGKVSSFGFLTGKDLEAAQKSLEAAPSQAK